MIWILDPENVLLQLETCSRISLTNPDSGKCIAFQSNYTKSFMSQIITSPLTTESSGSLKKGHAWALSLTD